VSELCDLLGAARATLYLADEHDGAIQALYTYDAHDGRLYVPLLAALQPAVDIIWQQVAASLEPLIIADPQHDPLIPNRERMRELGIVELLEVPMVVGTRAIGLVAVARQVASPPFDDAALR